MSASIHPTSISMAIARYLDSVSSSRSPNTLRTYRNGLRCFADCLAKREIDIQTCGTDNLPEQSIGWFIAFLKNHAPTSERLYLTAAAGFFEFISAENLAAVNLPKVHLLIRQRARRPGIRLPQFPRQAIDAVLEYVKNITASTVEDETDRLINLRDRAFLITLADTGMRVHEACKLRRGDLDLFEGKAVIIGKGNKEAVVRFSRRSIRAIRDYLSVRQAPDGAGKRAISALPVFARHDKGAGNRILPITTRTGDEIVARRVREALGEDAVGTITPHSFRHYFVTMVLRSSGNLKLAQELARHASISVTQRYTHLSDDELDRGYQAAIDRDENEP